MSRCNRRHQANSPVATLGRRRLAKRSQLLKRSYAWMEAMETRRLLSGYVGQTFTLSAQANSTANGTYLQGLIDGTQTIGSGHTVTLGDTLILPAGQDYDMGNKELELPNLGAGAQPGICRFQSTLERPAREFHVSR